MDIKERIKQFADSKGIPIYKFESTAGLSNGYVNGIRKGIASDLRLITCLMMKSSAVVIVSFFLNACFSAAFALLYRGKYGYLRILLRRFVVVFNKLRRLRL